MRAVADSSPLIALSTIGRLDLLFQRFPGGISVPPAVWREVVDTGRREGHIASLREQLDALQTQVSFHLSPAVVAEALRLAGDSVE
ncbi:MAG: DUF3368 domain-containing protein [Candidatus Latescibacterota bacterium]